MNLADLTDEELDEAIRLATTAQTADVQENGQLPMPDATAPAPQPVTQDDTQLQIPQAQEPQGGEYGRVDEQYRNIRPSDFADNPEMTGAEAAGLNVQAQTGMVSEHDGTFLGGMKALWQSFAQNSSGKLTASNVNKWQQIAARGYDEDSEGHFRPLYDMSDEEQNYIVDSMGANGALRYFGSFIGLSGFGSRGDEDLMRQWDETDGARIADPEQRRFARAKYVQDIAKAVIGEKEGLKQAAEMEQSAREESFGGELLRGLVEQGAYTLPFMAPGIGPVLAGAIEGGDRYNELRADELEMDADGNLNAKARRDDVGDAALKAGARGVIAPTIEMVGGKALKPVGWMLGKVPLFKTVGNKVLATSAGRAIDLWMKRMRLFGRITGMQSAPEEFVEEFEDQVIDAGLGLDRREDEKQGTTALGRAAESAADFFKPENIGELAKSMLLMQVLQSGIAYQADRYNARNYRIDVETQGADGKKSKVPTYTNLDAILSMAGIDRTELGLYTAEEKNAAVDAWVRGLTEQEIVDRFKGGAKEINRLMSAMAEAARSFDFGAAAHEKNGEVKAKFTPPTVTVGDGTPQVIWDEKVDADGSAYRSMTDAESGVTVDEIRDKESGQTRYRIHDGRGRVRAAETFDSARAYADEMADRNLERNNKLKYVDYLMNDGVLRGIDVVVADSLNDARQQLGEPMWNALTSSREYREAEAKHKGIGGIALPEVAGKRRVLLVLDNIHDVVEMNKTAAHEAAIHYGLTEMRQRGAATDFLKRLSKSGMEVADKMAFDNAVRSAALETGVDEKAVFNDEHTAEEVMAYAVEGFADRSPTAKNYIVAALREWYREHFNRDLAFNGDEIIKMARSLYDMADSRTGGSMTYESETNRNERERLQGEEWLAEERAAEEERRKQILTNAEAGEQIQHAATAEGLLSADEAAAQEIERNANPSRRPQLGYDPTQTSNGPIVTPQTEADAWKSSANPGNAWREQVTRGAEILRQMQGGERSNPQPKQETQQQQTQTEAGASETATTFDREGLAAIVEHFSDDAELNALVLDNATDDEAQDLLDAYALEDNGEEGIFNETLSSVAEAIRERLNPKSDEQKNLEKEDSERREREEKERAESERQAAEVETAFAEWLKKQPGRKDSKAARDEFADVAKATQNYAKSLRKRHGRQGALTRLNHALRTAVDADIGKRWVQKVGDGNLETALFKLNRRGALYDKATGEMSLAPFRTMAQGGGKSDAATEKAAVALRDFFSERYNRHIQAVRDKNTTAYGDLKEQRQKQAYENLVNKGYKDEQKALAEYAKANPESKMAEWLGRSMDVPSENDNAEIKDWWDSVVGGDRAMAKFLTGGTERVGTNDGSDTFNDIPGIGREDNGDVDWRSVTGWLDGLLAEREDALARAANGRGFGGEEEMHNSADVREGWKADYAEKPSWWDKDPWDMTSEEEAESDAFAESHPELRQREESEEEREAIAREMEEAGLTNDEADLHFRVAVDDAVSAYGKYAGDIRKLAHSMKVGRQRALVAGARLMAPLIPENAVIVPMPNHEGKPIRTMLLGYCISGERDDVDVVPALLAEPHEGSYHDKRLHKKPNVTMYRDEAVEIPEGRPIVVIDNVIASGATWNAAKKVLPNATLVTLADARGSRGARKQQPTDRYFNSTGDATMNFRVARESELNLGTEKEYAATLDKGVFSDGTERKVGAESIVYRTGDTVTKLRKLDGMGEDDLNKAKWHGELFPDMAYERVGFVEDGNGEGMRLVMRQPYVDVDNGEGKGTEARRQLVEYLRGRFGADNVKTHGDISESRLLDPKSWFSVDAGPWHIEDLKDANVGIDRRDGKFRCWDCTITRREGAEAKKGNGNVPNFRISPVTPAEDAAYMDAVKRGDMDTAARMVQGLLNISSAESAKTGEPITVEAFRGSRSGKAYTVFDSKRHPNGSWFFSTKKEAENWSLSGGKSVDDVYHTYLHFNNPFVVDAKGSSYDAIRNPWIKEQNGGLTEEAALWANAKKTLIETDGIAINARARGYDGVVFVNVNENSASFADGRTSSSDVIFVTFNPSQIKSADPVTYDDAGNVIPLSQRFNAQNSDIRFRVVGIREDGVEIFRTEPDFTLGRKHVAKAARDAMRSYFGGRTVRFWKDGKVKYATFKNRDVQKLVHSAKGSYGKGNEIKLDAMTNGDFFDIVEHSQYAGSVPDSGKHNQGIADSWDYFVKKMEIDGEDYNVLVSVRNVGDNSYVYDVQLSNEADPKQEYSPVLNNRSPSLASRLKGTKASGVPFAMSIGDAIPTADIVPNPGLVRNAGLTPFSEWISTGGFAGKVGELLRREAMERGETLGADHLGTPSRSSMRNPVVRERNYGQDVGDIGDNGNEANFRINYTPDPALRALADSYGMTPKELADLRAKLARVGISQSRNLGPTQKEIVDAAGQGVGNFLRMFYGKGASERFGAVGDAIVRRIQDAYIDLKRAEQRVAKLDTDGKDMEKSAYHAVRFAYGKASNNLYEIQNRFLEPFKREMAKLGLYKDMSERNPAITKVHELFLALHGPAFNRMIAERTNGDDLQGSGQTTQYWLDTLRHYGAVGNDAALLAALESGTVRFAPGSFGEKALPVMQHVYDMNAWVRDLLMRSGRLSAAQKAMWENLSPYYVPSRFDMTADQNFAESLLYGKKDIEEIHTKAYTQGESKHAFGHSGTPDDPVAFAVQQAETAILRAADNEMRTKLAELVESTPGMGRVVDATDKSLAHTLPQIPVLGQNGKVHYVPDVNGVESKHANYVAFKRNGNLHFIVLGTEEKKADGTYLNESDGFLSMENAKIIGRAVKKDSFAKADGVMGALQKFSRLFGELRTSFSPEFCISNFLADGTQAARNLHADFGAGSYKQFLHYWLPAIKTAHRLINGKLGTTTLDNYAREMVARGGMIGGFATENFKDIERNIRRDMMGYASGKVGFMNFVRSVGQKVNGPIELATRIASYAVAYENYKAQGDTDSLAATRAASYARDVTVDFNRKGEWTPLLNSWFVFSNANIQDMRRSGLAFAGRYGLRMGFGLFALGVVSSLLGFYQDEPDDDIEGNPSWANQKEYVKQNKLGVRVGKTFFSAPIRGISRIPYYLGHKFYEVVGGKTSAAEAAKDMAVFVANNATEPIGDAPIDSTLNPISNEGVKKLIKGALPSVLRPGYELMANESFTGAPIYRDAMPGTQQVRSEMGRESTSSIAKGTAKALNWLTGGNRARRGALDVPPEAVAHVFQWLTGSVGQDAARMANLVGDIARMDFDDVNVLKDVGNVRNIPGLRRFASGIDVNSAKFHEEQKAFEADEKVAKEMGDDAREMAALADRRAYYAPTREAKRWREELQDLSKAQKKLMKMEMQSEGETRDRLHALRMKAQALFLRRIGNAPATDERVSRADERRHTRLADRFVKKRKAEIERDERKAWRNPMMR